MALELETKFFLDDCHDFERTLSADCRLIKAWHFEANTIYDREGELFHANKLLRLRVTDHGILTLKIPAPTQETALVKARIETECHIQNPAQMAIILQELGYVQRLRYEKFRAIWQLERSTLFLDILPFGHFLEIEGEPEEIKRSCTSMGLDPDKGTSANYHTLHQAWRNKHGLVPDDNFIFPETEKKRLMTLLNCSPVILQGELHAD